MLTIYSQCDESHRQIIFWSSRRTFWQRSTVKGSWGIEKCKEYLLTNKFEFESNFLQQFENVPIHRQNSIKKWAKLTLYNICLLLLKEMVGWLAYVVI